MRRQIILLAILITAFAPIGAKAVDDLCGPGQVRRDNSTCLDGETPVYQCPSCPDTGDYSVCCAVLSPCECRPSCNSYLEAEQYGVCTANNCNSPTLTPNSCQVCQNNGIYDPGTLVNNPAKMINAVCGGDSGNNDLCINPTPSCNVGTVANVVVGSVTTNWECVGVCGGQNTVCSASKQDPVIDTYWSDFSDWGFCNVSCGDGEMTRNKTCLDGTSCGNTTCSVGSTIMDTGVCNMGCCPVDGSNGVCGIANGLDYESEPVPEDLCEEGTASLVEVSDDKYKWTCLGESATCFGVQGLDALCEAEKNNIPEFVSLELKNSSNQIIAPDQGNINQICDSRFSMRNVRFVVEVNDIDNDIYKVYLKVGSKNLETETIIDNKAIFNVNFNVNEAVSTSNIMVKISDIQGLETEWIDTGRDFKVWSCKVGISGSLYKGVVTSFDNVDCSNDSNFETLVESSIGYNLQYLDLFGADHKDMNVSSPHYNQGTNHLVWGQNYSPSFTNIDGQTPSMRIEGDDACTNVLYLNDSSLINPYDESPVLRVSFSSILAQLPWFQVVGSGALAKNTITNNIPTSCTGTCVSSMLLNGENASSGLVAAKNIIKGAGSYSETNSGISRNIIPVDFSYKYFYNEYFIKSSYGKVYSESMNLAQIISDVGGTGVVFVNGDLTINENNILSTSEFLMLIVSGDIHVTDSANIVSGLFVTDKNFIADGFSNNQLAINGIVYAKNDIRFSRGYLQALDNNKNPSVVVNYRPDLIFSMPTFLSKTLVTWREGR